MSQNESSLLLRIRGDASGGKAAVAETRAAVAQLRQSFGPELTQTVSNTNKVFSEISDNLNVFVGQRLPLFGGAFVRVTENVRGLGGETAKQEAAIKKVADQITNLSTTTGKSIPSITQFLSTFAKIEGQANRDAAAIKFFGAEVLANNAKIIPAAEKAAEGLATVATASEGAGVAAGAMALPIGIAVVALLGLAAGTAKAAQELFDLSKHAAEFQGRMFDLAQQTGLAVETLSALEIVAKTTGGDIGNLTQSIVAFQRKLDDAQDPLSKTAELFKKYKISIADTETSLRSAFKALAAMPEGFAQTNAAAELFGSRGGKQILAILKETNGDLDEAIKRFRDLGILISSEDARAADKFNDELEILNFQLRAASAVAAKELIPAFIGVIQSVGTLVRDLRPLLSLFGNLAGPVVRSVGQGLKGLGIVVGVLTGDFRALAEAIKESNEEANIFHDINSQAIPIINVPALTPVKRPEQTPQDAAREAAQLADAVVAIAKRSAAEQKQILAELFQKGRIDRETEAESTIASNKRVVESEKARLEALIDQKSAEAKQLEFGSDAYKKAGEEIQKLQQQQLDAESLFQTTSREIRARAAKERADARRNEEKNNTDILIGEFDRQIRGIEAAAKQGTAIEEASLTAVEQLERAKIDARIEGLRKQKEIGLLSARDRKEIDDQIERARIERLDLEEEQSIRRVEQLEQAKLEARIAAIQQQKAIGQLTIQQQKDLDGELLKLNQDHDRLLDDQADAKIERDRARAQRSKEIKLAEIDTAIQLQQIVAERTIASIESLAAQRIKSEEQAAKEILRIKLDLIDQEIEATEAKLKASASIVNVGERTRAEAELNNQIKILKEQRVSIEAEGNRNIESKRQEDLQNEREYADGLKEIKARISDVERDAAEEAIRLLRIHFASRRDIIRARIQLDIDDENARHSQAEETLRNLEQENRESKKTEQEKLEFEREINALREAEAERHRLVMQGIKDQGKKDEKEADPLGRLDLSIENVKEFASVIESTIVPLGEILTNTFLQVADAIGQTVANWVLLGETGPAVMRKILAQALASIAAEAAVNAIKELALGFATLFFNPAESAAHFTSAALWGSIAGVAAVAGRSVAGDLFKQKSAGGGDRAGSGGGGSSPPSALQTIVQGRNQQPQVNVTVQLKGDDSKLGNFITAHVVSNVGDGGEIREVLANDRRSS